MFGFILAISGSLFNELSDTIGKKKIEDKKVGVYTIGFLTVIFGFVFYAVSAYFRNSFVFSLDSLPTFVVRMIAETILNYVVINALAKADRSTFGFVRSLTIPLLLITDLFMGYSISNTKLLGIFIIFVSIFFIFFSKDINKKGIGLLVTGSILAVITLSIYKYDIKHFNSVEGEQMMASLINIIFFFLMAKFKDKENPFIFLKKPIFLAQAIFSGFSSVLGGFAYLFGSPSVIVTTLRGSAILFSTLSGDFYFKEKKLSTKLALSFSIVIGLIFLI